MAQAALADPTTLEEVAMVVSRMNKGRSTGTDGIRAELLQYGEEKHLLQLHSLFGRITAGETVPEEWSDTVMVVFTKTRITWKIVVTIGEYLCFLL